jgi:hypothetical protein
MSAPNFLILYVNNPPASTEFYIKLLGKMPIEASATFAMFALESGVMIGLWSRHTVEPAAETLRVPSTLLNIIYIMRNT